MKGVNDMFENTRKVLDEFESSYNDVMNNGWNVSEEDRNVLDYFSVHLAKALMQDGYILDISVAKIILATRDLSSDITVKVE